MYTLKLLCEIPSLENTIYLETLVNKDKVVSEQRHYEALLGI
jgi:hypothetical protein